MKLKSLFTIAAASLMLAACQGQGAKNAASADDTAKADSLIYYFAQMRGADYLRQAESDSVRNSKQSRQEFISGVRAGLAAVKADKDAYNEGVFVGMQMAMNMAQFEKEYGVRPSDRVFMEGLSKTLNADSVPNAQEIQKEFYRIIGDFNAQKEARDKEQGAKALAKAAESNGLAKISDTLYGKVANSDAPKIKDGDKVNVDITITDAEGKELSAPMPKTFTVGQRMKNTPVSEAILTLASGEKGSFATTALAMYGARCSQMGLEPSDVISFVVTATVEEPAKTAE